MKRCTILIFALWLSGCGYSSVENEAVGQAKKIANATPLLCYDHIDFDMSLGVMRNGTGSMSTEDMWFTLQNPADAEVLKAAVAKGAVVRLQYKVARVTLCIENYIITKVISVE